jgi:hypothetical protein
LCSCRIAIAMTLLLKRRFFSKHQSMIPEKWTPVFRKDHAQSGFQRAMGS